MGDGGAGRELVFISYSHADDTWLARLQVFLKPYVRQGRLSVWADPYIKVGDRWRREIAGALARRHSVPSQTASTGWRWTRRRSRLAKALYQGRAE